MIKKLFCTAILLAFTTYGMSQATADERAKEITREMVEVLSLNADQKNKVYKVQFERFTIADQIRQEHMDAPQTRKFKLKKVYDKLYGKLSAVLGDELMMRWKQYKQNN